MASNSEFFVKLTPLFSVNGQSYFPTSLLYSKEGVSTPGLMNESDSRATGVRDAIYTSEFKLRLGQHTPGSTSGALAVRCPDGRERTPYEITKDYFEVFLRQMAIAPQFQSKTKTKFMIAEPLKFQLSEEADPNWLPNYRSNIRRILETYGDVGFLPEPFAVYQYYRYGERHPEVALKQKHVSLILDFGGGTFDVCVIESTEEGDIAQSGKHSRPFGAASVPFGGFKLNRAIAEYILFQGEMDNRERTDLKKNLSLYDNCKRGEQRFNDLGDKKKAFITNFENLLNEVEVKKKELVRKIDANWSLNGPAYEVVYLDIPEDIYRADGVLSSRPFYGHNFREVFIHRCWNTRLKPTIRKCLQSASEQLRGKEITSVLMSGGSANIKWLANLVRTEFESDLDDASFVDLLKNYQDIVARGLAIECARRMHEPDSEFVGVSYNPLRLKLSADGGGAERPSFKSTFKVVDMEGAKPGDLIPSATALKEFIDQPISWKFKLSKQPSRELGFEFMSSTQEDDVSERVLNVSKRVFVRKKSIDSKPTVEITIGEDGTIRPRFIFQKEDSHQRKDEYAENAEPFALDMTSLSRSFSENTQNGVTYIGFDFGTSFSSISRITNKHIDKLEARARSKTWRELGDLPEILSYPVATTLRQYLAKENEHEERDALLEMLEASLSTLAYSAVVEVSARGKGVEISGPVRNFMRKKRAYGSLLELIRSTIPLVDPASTFGKRLKTLWLKFGEELSNIGRVLNDAKHHKGNGYIAPERIAEYLNEFKIVFEQMEFGLIPECKASDLEPGVHHGTFFTANGVPPFYRTRKFETDGAPLSAHVVLYSKEQQQFISVFPFAVWKKNGSAEFELFLFDSFDGNEVVFKTMSGRGSERWSKHDEYGRAVFMATDAITEKHMPLPSICWKVLERAVEVESED